MPTRQTLEGDVLVKLAAGASAADSAAVWPTDSWEAVRRSGVLGWSIPTIYDGQELDELELLECYEQLAGACLTTCFILSQRDAACRRLRSSGNETLCRELLPGLARGDSFATVGLSQLTTSRQHLGPSLFVKSVAEDFVLDGTIPWVTGAARADHFIVGGVLEDGNQILAVMPRALPGVSVGPPLDLMALQGSLTAEVHCHQVRLRRSWLLAGPAERVMAVGRGGGSGGLETSCLAVGLAGAAIDFLLHEARTRSELQGTGERLDRTRQALRKEIHRLAQEGSSPEAAGQLRARANTLVLRASQAALTASKGTGFLRNHPAQRWARQALFFLVWSCPRPVADATLTFLSSPVESECS